jgi:hypothetical protein
MEASEKCVYKNSSNKKQTNKKYHRQALEISFYFLSLFFKLSTFAGFDAQ